MEQPSIDQSKNQNFFQKNQIYIVGAVIVVLIVIYFSVVRNQNQNNENANNESAEQTAGENIDQNQEQTGNQEANASQETEGNVTAAGTLRVSDDSQKGNLMIESSLGKIYIATVRNFDQFIDKPVALQAQGTIENFVLLNLVSDEKEETGIGGPGEDEIDEQVSSAVSFSGVLQVSDNVDRGNYLISSGNTKVYLQSVRDYSAWIGSEVELAAQGTIQSFTKASLSHK